MEVLMNARGCHFTRVNGMEINIICGFDISREPTIPPLFFRGKIFVGCNFSGMAFSPKTDFSGAVFIDPDLTDTVFPMDVDFTDTHILFAEDKDAPRLQGMCVPSAALHSFVRALGRATPDNGFYRTSREHAQSHFRDIQMMLALGFRVSGAGGTAQENPGRTRQLSFIDMLRQ